LYNVHYFRELVSNELVKVLKFKTNFFVGSYPISFHIQNIF